MISPTLRNRVMDDPCISYWLKGAILELEQRDPVDALADAELLLAVMESNCQRALTQA